MCAAVDDDSTPRGNKRLIGEHESDGGVADADTTAQSTQHVDGHQRTTAENEDMT